ncbi:MAG: cutinase family protein [Corynebacterium sp.]|nr:cutinase family protein [Corynebacterium sp.]
MRFLLVLSGILSLSVAVADEALASPVDGFTCQALTAIMVPGTGESSFDDSPYSPPIYEEPTIGPMTHYLRDSLAGESVTIWQLPYPGTVLNYQASRQAAMNKLNAVLPQMLTQCPDARFIIVGFSQGADIAGDMAMNIGNNAGPIPAEKLAGAALLSDPRRVPGVANDVAPAGQGRGVLIAFQPIFAIALELAISHGVDKFIVDILRDVQPLGPRPQGFGQVSDRVFSICAANDPVCDVPVSGVDLLRFPLLLNRLHAEYVYNPWIVQGLTPTTLLGGMTIPQWLENWIRVLLK